MTTGTIPFRETRRASDSWTVWFTGLSGSGKSTLARALSQHLEALSMDHEVIDGDEIRQELCWDLGFSREDRHENVRRIGYVARLLNRHQVVSIVAAIAPYRNDRQEVRRKISRFVEVHVDCSLATLRQRDVKGLYQRALTGEIKNFSGVSDPYEPPLSPDLYLNTGLQRKEECVALLASKLEDLGWLPPGCAPAPQRTQAQTAGGAGLHQESRHHAPEAGQSKSRQEHHRTLSDTGRAGSGLRMTDALAQQGIE